jgi:hypothetical protein
MNPASNTDVLAPLLAAIVSAENPAERTDRKGTDLWLIRVIVGVTRDLRSLWCNNLRLSWDALTLIPPPGTVMEDVRPVPYRSFGRYSTVRRNTDTCMTFGASWWLTWVRCGI